MADYFTHFSCLLDVGTPENAARALELYKALSAGRRLGGTALRRVSALDSSPSTAAASSGCATTSPAIPNG